jgi:hypothetical protein
MEVWLSGCTQVVLVGFKAHRKCAGDQILINASKILPAHGDQIVKLLFVLAINHTLTAGSLT